MAERRERQEGEKRTARGREENGEEGDLRELDYLRVCSKRALDYLLGLQNLGSLEFERKG
ncbi:hypothetical protein L484_022748 [Morus notabilis]|uniref:Uncharacterized protein n=1 Tax=Morus notabilis TaxID=981085 RepID=W9SCD1_9ROSA|nr:hypothetical protein L484_022748 [Morus notabilis]